MRNPFFQFGKAGESDSALESYLRPAWSQVLTRAKVNSVYGIKNPPGDRDTLTKKLEGTTILRITKVGEKFLCEHLAVYLYRR